MDALITLGRYLGQGGLICDTFRKRLESMIDTYIELKFEPHIIISGGDLNGTG